MTPEELSRIQGRLRTNGELTPEQEAIKAMSDRIKSLESRLEAADQLALHLKWTCESLRLVIVTGVHPDGRDSRVRDNALSALTAYRKGDTAK